MKLEGDISYFVHINTNLNDGGISRNLAFLEYFASIRAKIHNVFQKSKVYRSLNAFLIIKFFLLAKNQVIFIHQGTILYLFPMSFLKYPLVSKLIFYVLMGTARKNKLIIEVNDLPYEQSIDLELNVDINYKIFEESLYSIEKCNYIFASNEMEKYIVNKFGLNREFCETIINGASKLEHDPDLDLSNYIWMESTKLKFVYAGTLNKGRQIEELIDIFENNKECNLILLGDWGEWLLERQLSSNIYYLGNQENTLAQKITSMCDFGLIQYSSDRFYYNLCFPTKISFYLTAGIPVLSTPLKELMNEFAQSNAVFFRPFDDWKDFIEIIGTEEILAAKINAKKESSNYEWSTILGESKFLKCII